MKNIIVCNECGDTIKDLRLSKCEVIKMDISLCKECFKKMIERQHQEIKGSI